MFTYGIFLTVIPQKCGIHTMMLRQDKAFIIEKNYGKTNSCFVKNKSSRLGCRMGLRHDSRWCEMRFSKRSVNPIPLCARLVPIIHAEDFGLDKIDLIAA